MSYTAYIVPEPEMAVLLSSGHEWSVMSANRSRPVRQMVSNVRQPEKKFRDHLADIRDHLTGLLISVRDHLAHTHRRCVCVGTGARQRARTRGVD